jgi:hypothetical protein
MPMMGRYQQAKMRTAVMVWYGSSTRMALIMNAFQE